MKKSVHFVLKLILALEVMVGEEKCSFCFEALE